MDDVEGFAEVMQPAFAEDHIIKYISMNVLPPLQREHDIRLFQTWLKGDVYGYRFTKAVENATG